MCDNSEREPDVFQCESRGIPHIHVPIEAYSAQGPISIEYSASSARPRQAGIYIKVADLKLDRKGKSKI